MAKRRSEAGQTATEYLMILGVLTAVMISIGAMVRPMISWVVVQVTQHEAVHLSTPQQ